MKLLVTIHSHFQSVEGEVFSHHLTYERFWKRYLGVFSSVLVVSRVRAVATIPDDWNKATGPGVEFCAVPDYYGPWEYLRVRGKVASVLRDAIKRSNAYILRLPGMLGTLVWKNLPKGTPYGVEVVMDPWDAFAPGSVKSLGRSFFRQQWTRNLKKQCRQAVAASYVTEYALQQRYPPNDDAFTTHYSSVDLDSSFIISDPGKRLADIETIPKRLQGNGSPVRLGFIGSFSQGHKRPDLHIRALSKCVVQGANVLLEMIGDGFMVSNMKNLARRLGVAERVIFRGRIPGGKPIFDAIDTFDLLLNATATEGLPRVVIEAMARGCPCIGSDVGGISELIQDGFLVPPLNPTALADKIIEVLKDPKRMADVVSHSINHARQYCRDALQPRRRAFYQALQERTEKYLSERL